MQTIRILQAVALMLIVATAASCTASKEYTSKLFAPRSPMVKDSQVAALRFLDADSSEFTTSDWVTTDIIMGRDTVNRTFALDNFSKSFPATPAAKAKPDSLTELKGTPDALVKTSVVTDDPVTKTAVANSVRTKKSRED